MARTTKPNMSEETVETPVQAAAPTSAGTAAASDSGSGYPPAPQAAAEGLTQQNPLEGLPPAAQQHIIVLTQYVGQIIRALQEFIPAITQRLAEIEAQLGGETAEPTMGMPAENAAAQQPPV